MDWRIGAALHLEPDADLPFSVEYVREDGTRCHELLLACAGERFEDARPVRSLVREYRFMTSSDVLRVPKRRTR